jgi:hypothetical protein
LVTLMIKNTEAAVDFAMLVVDQAAEPIDTE